MKLTRGASATVLVAALVGCGGDSAPAIAVGGGGMNNPPTTPRDGGVDAATPVSTVGPIVSLMGLIASSDPVAGPVLTGSSVDVTCEAKPRTSSAAVDPAKVSVSIYGSASADALATVPATLQGTDTYKASVPLDKVPTGVVRVRCAASDKTMAPQVGFTEVQTFYDAGPVITFTNLNAMSVVSRGKNQDIDLPVQFKVEPARLSELDVGADVAEVKLTISERDVEIGAPVDGVYAKGIDFETFFAGAPIASVTVAVTATNKRTGAAATSKKQLIVKVDGLGPVIVVTKPAAPNTIVGGTVEVVMTITDDLAGLATSADKLFAQIQNDEARMYPLTSQGNNVYSFTFEALQYSSTSNIEAQINAVDRAGNATVEAFTMRLDTVPPWISLTPSNVRVVVAGTPPSCSGTFDPVGLSPEDGQVILQDARFRAMVWERGIQVGGAASTPIAGVQTDSVNLYAQGNPAVPLIYNQSGTVGGPCDAINATPKVAADAPYKKELSPVATTGNLRGAGTEAANDLAQDPPVTWCNPLGGSTTPADKCRDSELSYVIGQTIEGAPPAIYGSQPTSAGLDCTGGSFDIKRAAGWACIAVEVRDRTGNLGISEPIRVCRKLKDADCDYAAAGTILTPPATLTCTDGCVMPTLWKTRPLGSSVLQY